MRTGSQGPFFFPRNRPRLLVSACLCGIPCRYDGGACPVQELVELAAAGKILPVCPESLAGLPTPRSPCEIRGNRVFSQNGRDMTEAFARGAARTLALARQHEISAAVLKENSPSCGVSRIHDGSFKGGITAGRGVTASLLHSHGIRLHSEMDTPLIGHRH